MASIGPHLYICGGSDDSSRLDTVERYDPFVDAWVPSEPMSSSRNGVGVCSDDGRIYAIGTGSGVCVCDCGGGIRDFHLHHSHSKYDNNNNNPLFLVLLYNTNKLIKVLDACNNLKAK